MNNIQHRFLVSSDIRRWLKKYSPTIHKTEQFYTVSNAQESCYYHKHFPDTYTKTVVGDDGNEKIVSVSEEEYASQRKNHLGRVIIKTSHRVMLDEGTFVVEKYLKKLEGLYILIASFEDEKAFRNSERVRELQPFVLKEIDLDDKYSDHSLAVYVKPMEYDLQKFFEKIDAFESPNLFFWQVPQRVYVRDGVSLVLYRNIRLINYYKMNFQKKHFSATLHRLRVLLRRTATLLEIFPNLFSPHVQRSCIDLLQRYYEETTLLRYLYFLNELSATRKNVKLTLYSALKSLIIQEEESVTQMLSSKPFRQMLNILTREIGVQERQTYISLEQEVKRLLKERLGGLELLLEKTKEGYDDEVLEALYIFMDALQTLIEDFFHIIGEKESRMIVEELNILFKPLREYRNCKERAVILNDMKAKSETKTLDTDPLLCEHEEVLKERISHALKLLRSSRFYV